VCGFYPENINFQAAFKMGSPEKALDQQLFGASCSVLGGVVYTGNLRKQEQKMIYKMGTSIRGLVHASKVTKGGTAIQKKEQIEAIANEAKLVIHEQLPIDAIDFGTGEDIDALFDKWSSEQSSLLEFSSSDDSEQQDLVALAILIGVICIGLAFIIFVIAPMAADFR